MVLQELEYHFFSVSAKSDRKIRQDVGRVSISIFTDLDLPITSITVNTFRPMLGGKPVTESPLLTITMKNIHFCHVYIADGV